MTLFNYFYTMTGLLGLVIWIARSVIPWLKPRFSWMYFKVRFHRLFIGGLLGRGELVIGALDTPLKINNLALN